LSARLSIVLHTHMPYVEGYGTWPFGEEWLWEAIATSYLPLLDVLDAAPGQVTVSMTPVLADQLEAPGVLERCLAFLREIRPESHRLDLEGEADPAIAAELERGAALYAAAADALERRGSLVEAFAPHVSWTSSATHAVLPLLATDDGIRLQVESGVESFTERFGRWDGGFWLPECAHAPWLDELLEEAGVHLTCVDLTDVAGIEAGVPLRSPAGPLLMPIDREVIELVWSEGGYPGGAAYRDTHNLTEHLHGAWAVDRRPYDPARAAARVRADAEDFVARVLALGRQSICALDTELLGHWWHEGVDWLRAVLEVAGERGLTVGPVEQLAGEPVDAPELPVTSWGTPRDLSTWSGPPAGGLAWVQRREELRTTDPRRLLALQASDWAFLISRDTAGPYPRERFEAHLAGDDLRHLAPRPVSRRGLTPS
jgi:1,4-alpha-glucan branching enzyme